MTEGNEMNAQPDGAKSLFPFLAGKTIDHAEEDCSFVVKLVFTDGSAMKFMGTSAQGSDCLIVNYWEPGEHRYGTEVFNGRA